MTNFNQRRKSGGGGFKREGSNDFGRGSEMFKTICADCGKSCEVPFKPNGTKPVYCRDCFAKNGGPAAGGNDFPKKSFDRPRFDRPRPSFAPSYSTKPSFQGGSDASKSDALAKQLEAMNAKFDKLIALTETLVGKSAPKTEKETPAPKAEKTEKAEKPKKSAKKNK